MQTPPLSEATFVPPHTHSSVVVLQSPQARINYDGQILFNQTSSTSNGKKSAWMMKKISYFKNKRRLVVIDANKMICFYKKDLASAEASLSFGDVTQVVTVKDKEFRIELKDGSVVHLEADSMSERNDWVNHLLLKTQKFIGLPVEFQSIGYQLFDAAGPHWKDFCRDFCSVTYSDVIDLLTTGAQLSYTLLKDPNHPSKATPLGVTSLLWLLYYKISSYDLLFTSGTIRIDDPDGIIFKYLDSCPGTYTRWSSHFLERLAETFQFNPGAQRGLDIKNIPLPAQKSTLLYFRLGDGTTVIKLEYSGCPPFWQQEFRTLENALEFSKHAQDYVKTRIKPNKAMKIRRTERVPVKVIDIYNTALNVLFPRSDFYVQESQPGSEEDRRRFELLKQGTTFGISRMIEILTREIEPQRVLTRELTAVGSFIVDKDVSSLENLHDSFFKSTIFVGNGATISTEILHYIHQLKEFVKIDKERCYNGDRKGSEVCLPSFDYWTEVFNKCDGRKTTTTTTTTVDVEGEFVLI